MKRGYRGKRAALEMSIGTIVIIVLAMSMLILGMVLIRKIMCSGVVLTDKISAATESEISNLFQTGEIGMRCMGEEGQEVKLGGGGSRQIICIINDDTDTTHQITDITITKLGTTGTTDALLKTYLIKKTNFNIEVKSQKKTVTVAVLDLPRNIPNTKAELTFKDDQTGTHSLILDLVPSSGFSSAIC